MSESSLDPELAPALDERAAAARSEIARLAERLARLESGSAEALRESRALRASLRLRLARLRDTALGDPAAAVETLAPARAECGAIAAIAEPLADLLQRLRRFAALAELARDAASSVSAPHDRARWWRRCAEARSADGDAAGAVEAWRAALALAPHDRETFLGLVTTLARRRAWDETLRCLEERLARVGASEAVLLRRAMALVLDRALARPDEARAQEQRARQLARLLPDDEPGARALQPLLPALAGALASGAREEAAAPTPSTLARRASSLAQEDAALRFELASAELRLLPPGPSILDLRRRTLHAALSTLAAGPIDDPDAAIEHARARARLTGDEPEATRPSSAQTLCERLEAGGAWLELEAQLASEARAEGASGARALRRLARLRATTIGDLAGAARAWQALLEREEADPEAVRALCETARGAGDASALAGALERLLSRSGAQGELPAGEERAALWYELGLLLRDVVQARPRAMRAFAAALEASPRSADALHALQDLLVSVEDWKGAADLAHSELDLLPAGAREPRGRLWLRIARLCELADEQDPRAAEARAEARALGVVDRDAPNGCPIPEPAAPSPALEPPVVAAPPLASPAASASTAPSHAATACVPVSRATVCAAVAEGRFDEALVRLAALVDATPEPRQRARLRADEAAIRSGACADLTGARAALREAVALCPSDPALRGALADVLAGDPSTREEAAQRHRELLMHDPARIPSIAALAAIAAAEGHPALAEEGRALCAILERDPHARLRRAIGTDPALDHPLWDRLRRALSACAGPLDRALDFAMRPLTALPAEPRARFRELSLRAEAELTAASLVALDDESFGVVVRLVAGLAFGQDAVSGDASLVNRLADALRWRERRAVRALLAPFEAREVSDVSIPAFREELRGVAHAMAVDRSDGALGVALLALVEDEGAAAPSEAPLRLCIARAPSARALLRRACAAWSSAL